MLWISHVWIHNSPLKDQGFMKMSNLADRIVKFFVGPTRKKLNKRKSPYDLLMKVQEIFECTVG